MAKNKMEQKRYLFQDTAEVVVGSEKIKFTIHADLASKRSQFFKSAFSTAWSNDKTPIDLGDTDPQIFSDYLQLLYTGKIVHEKETQETFLKLVRLYTFADYIGDLQSANEVIQYIIVHSDEKYETPNAGCINLAITSIPAKSPLKRLLVDYYVHEINDLHDEDMEYFPPEFLKAVMRGFIEYRKEGHTQVFASDRSICHYHQHDDNCPRCDDIDKEREDDE